MPRILEKVGALKTNHSSSLSSILVEGEGHNKQNLNVNMQGARLESCIHLQCISYGKMQPNEASPTDAPQELPQLKYYLTKRQKYNLIIAYPICSKLKPICSFSSRCKKF